MIALKILILFIGSMVLINMLLTAWQKIRYCIRQYKHKKQEQKNNY